MSRRLNSSGPMDRPKDSARKRNAARMAMGAAMNSGRGPNGDPRSDLLNVRESSVAIGVHMLPMAIAGPRPERRPDAQRAQAWRSGPLDRNHRCCGTTPVSTPGKMAPASFACGFPRRSVRQQG